MFCELFAIEEKKKNYRMRSNLVFEPAAERPSGIYQTQQFKGRRNLWKARNLLPPGGTEMSPFLILLPTKSESSPLQFPT